MKNKLLILILFIAALLRFWNLGNYPPTLTQDEASLGYNAYSILKTGKDEFGKTLPVIFQSFGDYKPGLYVYLAIPFVAVLGLSEWSVRLPSAIAGILIVYLIYKIVLEFARRNNKPLTTNNLRLAKTSAFVAALSPWLIHFSRGAWEANLSLVLTLAGIYFFLRSFNNVKFLFHSAIFFSLTFITYQGAKLSTSIVVLILAILFFNKVKDWFSNSKSIIASSLIISILIASPVILSFFSGQTGRLSVFSIFSYPRPTEYTQEFLDKAGEEKDTPTYYLYHSESLNFLRGIMGRWFNHFSGRFLFFEGEYQNPRHSSPYHGMMLLVDFILLPLGFFALFRTKNYKFSLFVLLWLILSPLPAALTRDQVHGVRALNMSVPLIMISGAGLNLIYESVRKNILKWIIYGSLTAAYILSLVYYFDAYFVHSYKHNARYWFYGYKEVIEKVSELRGNYDTVIFQQSYNQPYIYFLFYEKYDPRKFQEEYVFKSGGSDVGVIEELENIDFQFYSWPPEIKEKRTLIAGDTVVIPDNYDRERFNLLYEIKYPDGVTTAYRILETRQNNK